MKRMNLAESLFVLIAPLIFLFSQGTNAQTDDILAKKVTAAITSKYPPENIIVTSKDDGWVILNGTADLLYNKDMMYELAARVYGVKRITNDIAIVPATIHGDDDPNSEPDFLPNDVIKEDVINQLRRSPDIKEPEKIEVNVDNALVTLSGRVHYYDEKILAETIASQVKGVYGIENDITLTPLKEAMADNEIRDVLVSVLNKDFPLVDQGRINFTVNHGTVTVWGTVSNLWIKDSIAKEFKSIEGVKSVVNNLAVKPEMEG